MKWFLQRVTFWRLVLLLIAVTGVYSILLRFLRGLGATTGMDDSCPWGIWIGFDILCGVGLSAGAFTVAALVYVFKMERYRPILRATVLTAFLGYLMAIVSLLCDLGMPQRIWHPLFMRNLHSPLFEVAMCVMIYTGVLALEFSPALFERMKLQAPLRWVHAVSLPLVVLGVLLSTLHQSSLGTLYIIVPNKLHGLWYTPLLPVFFYVSAIGAGMSMVIFESYMSHRAFGTSLHRDVLEGLAKGSATVLLVCLIGRLIDLAARGKMGLILEGSSESRMFLLEILLGGLLPVVLYLTPRVRKSRIGLYLTAILALCGFVLYRLNVSLTGLQRYAGHTYFPTWMEVSTTVFIVACGFAAFGGIARWLPVFPASGDGSHEGAVYTPLASMPVASVSRQPIATPAAFAFLCGLAMAFALAAIFEHAHGLAVSSHRILDTGGSRAANVASRMSVASLRLPPDVRFPEGRTSPGGVVFRHETHVAGQNLPCEICHAELFPMQSPRRRGAQHTLEMMDRCSSCHNGIKSFHVSKGCGLCHARQDAASVLAVSDRQIPPPGDFEYASQRRSPGRVPFSHRRHLKSSGGDCTRCHPSVFGMAFESKRGMRMGSMRGGRECGACHNGLQTFTVAKDCGLCHLRGKQPAARAVAAKNRVPADQLLRDTRPPGPVVFSHRSHLGRGGSCSTCHPRLFPMGQYSGLRMASLKAGKECGACHDGRKAFTVANDCELCHQSKATQATQKPLASNDRVLPADYKIPVGEGSPGVVVFSHAKHFAYVDRQCKECHPKTFPMHKPPQGSLAMAKITGGQQCSSCHDAKRAFGLEDDCSRCHGS
ncbi:MAG: Ni/Fe-hydrogenase cytochrome b subunit [Armatimonadetes bacterium]|nr:Ni/Fe-hydrogenase cytochrome b subunit [Armatimonadota bacterium]